MANKFSKNPYTYKNLVSGYKKTSKRFPIVEKGIEKEELKENTQVKNEIKQ